MTYIGVLSLLRRSMVTIREYVPLAPYTYFKIGGPARFFCEAHNETELFEALYFARRKKVPFWIFGGGSNVLIADEGLPGLVIISRLNDLYEIDLYEIQSRKFDLYEIESRKLYAGAGVAMARAVAASVAAGLTGLEWAIGIPGTIGGSARGNAGCFGKEMKDVVESVEVFDTSCSSLRGATPQLRGSDVAIQREERDCHARLRLARNDCEFAYRESMFKHNTHLIILGATLQLKKGNPEESRKLIARYAKERTEKQDIGAKCAGCMFKNVIPLNGGAIIPAGWLIDTAGCKGTRVGHAMVSEKHANYFLNCGGATAADVQVLAALVKEKVKAFHGVALQEEIQYLY